MKLYRIVFKDVLRRKRRVLYSTLGVVVGTMTVVGILTIAQAGESRLYNQLEKYGANLTVAPAISNIDMKLGNFSLGSLTIGDNYIPENRLPEIQKIADGKIKEALGVKDEGNIATIAPKLYVNTQIDGIPVMVVGISPSEEMAIKTWWQVKRGQYLTEGDQAIIGASAAELLNLETGDKITLNGHTVSVTGILGETGSNEDYQIFTPLKTLQTAFNKEGLVSSLDVRALCNACPVEIIADAINQNIPGVRAVAVKQVAEAEMGVVERVNHFMLALAGMTLIVGCLGVINTMIAAVHERIKDIGIMKAVGASHTQIISVFIYEAIIIGIIGGILGYIVGTLLAYGIGPLIFEDTFITYIPMYLPLSLVVAIIIAIIAVAYPAYQATRIKVADCFRSL